MAKRKKRDVLRLTGRTPEGGLVVDGVFALVGTYGVPLDIALDQIRERGMVPDWLELFDAATFEGANPGRFADKLVQAVGDVYGPCYREGWEMRFRGALVERCRQEDKVADG